MPREVAASVNLGTGWGRKDTEPRNRKYWLARLVHLTTTSDMIKMTGRWRLTILWLYGWLWWRPRWRLALLSWLDDKIYIIYMI